jgi:hypothetical protein
MNDVPRILMRVAGPLSIAMFLAAATAMPAQACSKRAFAPVQPLFYFVFTALADTVEAGEAGAVMGVTSRHLAELSDAGIEGPVWGQRVRLRDAAGLDAEGLPPETEDLILGPWSYSPACAPRAWQQSARFIEPGETGFMFATLRDPEHWVDGIPTADVHNPYHHPYPQHTRRAPEDAMGVEDVFRLHHILPRPEDVGEDPLGAMTPLLDWAREHPDLARRWPASDMIRSHLRNVSYQEARRLEVPVAGTYRFVLDLGDGPPRTFYARTNTTPTGPAGLETGDAWFHELRPPSYTGYALWARGARLPELFGSLRPGHAGGYFHVFSSVDPTGGADRVPAGIELTLAANALPDDPGVQALHRAVRERFGTSEGREYLDLNLSAEANGFFQIHPDGEVTFEQTYHLPGDRIVTLRGVRIEAAEER